MKVSLEMVNQVFDICPCGKALGFLSSKNSYARGGVGGGGGSLSFGEK